MKLLKNFFNTNIRCKDNLSRRRVILVKSVLFLAVPVFIIFSIMNFFYIHQYIVAGMDVFAAIISIYAIYVLQRAKDLPKASIIATLNLMIFFILFIYTNGSSHFGLIWTIFLPIFAILVNGKRAGLYFSVFFYSIIYFMAYRAIGVWNDGEWLIQDFLRLVGSSMLLTYIMYMNEKALESSEEKLIQIRDKEKEYINNLHILSITDPLTELYNRRYFNEMAHKLISLAKRKKHSYTFFILDIDHFKLYNDNYGHIKGDEALKNISKVLKNYVQRDDDFIFRLGGEEFAGIIISDCPQDTHTWIESICDVIEDMKIEHCKSTTSKYITASIGVATISYENDFSIDEIYALADEALYLAKHNGKNRTELSDKSA